MSPSEKIVLSQYLLNGGWVLLPLVPAILIYIIFPKTEVGVGGPFKGLQLNATGSFAAYLIVLLATFPLIVDQNSNLRTLLHPSWDITGIVEVEDENGRRVDLTSAQSPLQVSLNPNPIRLLGADKFDVTVPEIGGRIPAIEIKYPGYGDVVADVENPELGENIKRDDFNKKVTITSKIVIRRQCEGSLCSTSPGR